MKSFSKILDMVTVFRLEIVTDNVGVKLLFLEQMLFCNAMETCLH